MKKKRILIVINDLRFFISHHFIQIALEAKKKGYEVIIVAPRNREVIEIVEKELEYVSWPLSRGSKNPIKEIFSIFILANIFFRFKPDLVYLITIKPVLYGGILARVMNIPSMVAEVTGMGSLFIGLDTRTSLGQYLLKFAYRFCFKHKISQVIILNLDDERTLISMKALQPGEAVIIKGSGVDLMRFKPAPLIGGTPLVVLPGRMLWDKGVSEFVEAAKILQSKSVNLRMALVGRYDRHNPSAVPLYQLEDWRDHGPVEWWGYCENMVEVFKNSHVIVLPSYREGFPKVLQEAAAAGRAIITTDVPGCRDVVEHGVNGWLVKPRDAQDLAESIYIAINNIPLLEIMGKNGRKKAEVEYDFENMVRAHLMIYQELCPINK